MRKIHGLLVALATSLAGFGISEASAQSAGCEPAKLATKYPALAGKTIKIGQDGESPPFSFRDPADFNRLVGLDADTARAVFACVGAPVEFVTGSWSGLIPATMSGQIDIMWDTLLYTPERAKRLDFVSYMSAASGIVVVKGNPKQIKSLDDICGLQGTAGLGTTQEAMLRDASAKCTAAGKKPVEVITSSDIPSGMRLVQNGRADLLATNKFLGDSMAAKNKAVETAFGIKTGAKIAVGTGKGNTDLVKAIADGLSILQENGELKKIFAAYDVDYDLVTKPEIITQ
ncbi:MAG: Amino acid transporter substrate-binding protein family [Enterovirga sp.]|jgi:polar amino acid transport system substrate-binding protein|nr:Amino acid transporter substrate-binding protein family [Enterovirga sp.]